MATNNSSKNPEEVAIPISNKTNEQSSNLGLQKLEFDPKPKYHPSNSQEISSVNNSPRKPPIHPTTPESPLIRRRLSKKSRFGEPSIPLESQNLESLGNSPRLLNQFSFFDNTPKTASGRSKADSAKEKDKQKEGPDEREIYRRVTDQLSARKNNFFTLKLVLELVAFFAILGCLISSLTIESFKGKLFFGLELWKWFTLLMVIFSGMLLTSWVVHCIVFVIEWKFLLKKNVVYFTHGLQTNVVVFLWIGLVLVTWIVLFKHDAKTTKRLTAKMKNVLDIMTWTIATLLIGSFLWLVKTTLIKVLASSFHLNRFFERIQEAVFHHYVLQTLSGRPVVELARRLSRGESHATQVSFKEYPVDGVKKQKKVVDWEKLHQMKQEKMPSWTMKLLVDVISNSGLSTMSSIIKQDVVEGGVELDDDEITCEEEAIATAVKIFFNVIGDRNELYLDRSDLLRFMIWEEVDLIYPLFELNEKRQVDIRAFSKWVKIKELKDKLANLGQVVSDKSLVLRMCAGLIDSDYDGVAQSITQLNPLPGFDEARSRLLLEETRLRAKDNSAQAFIAQHGAASAPVSSSPASASSPSQQRQHTGGSRGDYRGHNKKQNRGQHYKGKKQSHNNKGPNQPHQQAQSSNPTQQLWAAFQNCAQQSQWAIPPAPFPTQPHQQHHQSSILGRAPGPPQSYFAGPAMTPTDLANAFSTMTLQHPDSQWYFDTGASSHMTNNSGSTNGNSNNEMQ